ncbi:MAG: DNA-processing protein DprA [Candidatus Aminicenantales bacterium]
MEEDLVCWVALNLVVSENLKASRIIRDQARTPQDVLEAGKKELCALGMDAKTAEGLSSPDLLAQAEKDLRRIEKSGYKVLSIRDARYPDYLREIYDPPLVLYCMGNVEMLSEPCVSIVGSRRPTPYGRAVAERLARDLASRGLVVVSGLARGIDSAAHWGALKTGRTVAVLGSGLDTIYPREHRGLAERIAEEGAVCTEFPLGAKPLGFHFPQRNRVITGLSLGLIVVEAARRSGSLISARLALDQNREVMAVPGNITSGQSQGTNWLIKTGAKLVEDWTDVAEELPSPVRERVLEADGVGKPTPELSPDEQKIFRLLAPDETTSVDDLVEKTGLSVPEILSVLLSLELKDLVVQRPGKLFQRRL